MSHKRLTEKSTPATIIQDMIDDIESEITQMTGTIDRYRESVAELGVKKVFLKRLIEEAKQAEIRKEIEAEIVARRAEAEGVL